MLEEFRNMAKKRAGYISGETLINHMIPAALRLFLHADYRGLGSLAEQRQKGWQ